MTVPGIDMVVAVGVLATIGPVTRFEAPDKLVSYVGLNPIVDQSGEGRPRHGRISKQGRTHARTMLVEAAWQAVRGSGPLRAFYERVARRRGVHVAAVTVARKLAVIVWHLLRRGEDYAWVRPALHAKKLRDLELRSGQPDCRGQRGAAYAYNLTRTRLEERRRGEQAETAYRRQKSRAGHGADRKCPQAPQRGATLTLRGRALTSGPALRGAATHGHLENIIRSRKATADATPAFPRIVGKPPPAGMEITTEEHTRRGDAAEEAFRELVRRATLDEC